MGLPGRRGRRCGPAASSPRAASSTDDRARRPKWEDAMSQPADPISSPEAYRASLLAALGGDDPAVAQAETAGGDPCSHPRGPRSAAHSARARRMVRAGVHRPHPRWGARGVGPRALDPGRGRARHRRLRPGAVGRRAQTQRGRPGPAARHLRGPPPAPTSTSGRAARWRTASASGATGSADRRATT